MGEEVSQPTRIRRGGTLKTEGHPRAMGGTEAESRPGMFEKMVEFNLATTGGGPSPFSNVNPGLRVLLVGFL